MGLLIDSSTLIAMERGAEAATAAFAGREDEDFFVSVITASELLHGVWRAADAGVRARRSAFVEYVLQEFPVLPIGVAVARVHAQLWAELQCAGQGIGTHDLWIAATCLAHGLTLATRNLRDFQRVPGLTVLHR